MLNQVKFLSNFFLFDCSDIKSCLRFLKKVSRHSLRDHSCMVSSTKYFSRHFSHQVWTESHSLKDLMEILVRMQMDGILDDESCCAVLCWKKFFNAKNRRHSTYFLPRPINCHFYGFCVSCNLDWRCWDANCKCKTFPWNKNKGILINKIFNKMMIRRKYSQTPKRKRKLKSIKNTSRTVLIKSHFCRGVEDEGKIDLSKETPRHFLSPGNLSFSFFSIFFTLLLKLSSIMSGVFFVSFLGQRGEIFHPLTPCSS